LARAGAVAFTGLDAALADVFAAEFCGRLAALLAGFAFRALATAIFPERLRAEPAALAEEVFRDLLRVFLDIRLPFVAFRASIIGIMRVLSRQARSDSTAGQV
jgi:hypothetical protein